MKEGRNERKKGRKIKGNKVWEEYYAVRREKRVIEGRII